MDKIDTWLRNPQMRAGGAGCSMRVRRGGGKTIGGSVEADDGEATHGRFAGNAGWTVALRVTTGQRDCQQY